MFEVGDEVVCVEDEWGVSDAAFLGEIGFPLRKGETFVIQRVLPSVLKFSGTLATMTAWTRDGNPHVSIGRPNPVFSACCERFGIVIDSVDLWPSAYFRKVDKRRKHVRQALAQLIGLTATTPSKELEDA